MNKPTVIEVRVDSVIVANKYWHSVPRKGDRIILENLKVVEVEEVYYKDVGRESHYYDCWVQLVCKYVGEVKA
jgi:hypothetical protein